MLLANGLHYPLLSRKQVLNNLETYQPGRLLTRQQQTTRVWNSPNAESSTHFPPQINHNTSRTIHSALLPSYLGIISVSSANPCPTPTLHSAPMAPPP